MNHPNTTQQARKGHGVYRSELHEKSCNLLAELQSSPFGKRVINAIENAKSKEQRTKRTHKQTQTAIDVLKKQLSDRNVAQIPTYEPAKILDVYKKLLTEVFSSFQDHLDLVAGDNFPVPYIKGPHETAWDVYVEGLAINTPEYWAYSSAKAETEAAATAAKIAFKEHRCNYITYINLHYMNQQLTANLRSLIAYQTVLENLLKQADAAANKEDTEVNSITTTTTTSATTTTTTAEAGASNQAEQVEQVEQAGYIVETPVEATNPTDVVQLVPVAPVTRDNDPTLFFAVLLLIFAIFYRLG